MNFIVWDLKIDKNCAIVICFLLRARFNSSEIEVVFVQFARDGFIRASNHLDALYFERRMPTHLQGRTRRDLFVLRIAWFFTCLKYILVFLCQSQHYNNILIYSVYKKNSMLGIVQIYINILFICVTFGYTILNV